MMIEIGLPSCGVEVSKLKVFSAYPTYQYWEIQGGETPPLPQVPPDAFWIGGQSFGQDQTLDVETYFIDKSKHAPLINKASPHSFDWRKLAPADHHDGFGVFYESYEDFSLTLDANVFSSITLGQKSGTTHYPDTALYAIEMRFSCGVDTVEIDDDYMIDHLILNLGEEQNFVSGYFSASWGEGWASLDRSRSCGAVLTITIREDDEWGDGTKEVRIKPHQPPCDSCEDGEEGSDEPSDSPRPNTGVSTDTNIDLDLRQQFSAGFAEVSTSTSAGMIVWAPQTASTAANLESLKIPGVTDIAGPPTLSIPGTSYVVSIGDNRSSSRRPSFLMRRQTARLSHSNSTTSPPRRPSR